MQKLLVVEDEANACDAIITYFVQRGFETHFAHSYDQAVAIGADLMPDILISDWMLDGHGDGLDVAKRLRSLNRELKIIFITAYQPEILRNRAVGMTDIVLEKPVSLSRLFEEVTQFQ